MPKPMTDVSVFRKIEGLVHEEQHLYGKTEVADHDQVRLERFGSSSISAGICCASGTHGASSAKIRTMRTSARRRLSSDISSD
jgi:hypothetical protein